MSRTPAFGRSARVAVLALVAIASGACSAESLTAPAAAPSSAIGGPSRTGYVIVWGKPQDSTRTGARTQGAEKEQVKDAKGGKKAPKDSILDPTTGYVIVW